MNKEEKQNNTFHPYLSGTDSSKNNHPNIFNNFAEKSNSSLKIKENLIELDNPKENNEEENGFLDENIKKFLNLSFLNDEEEKNKEQDISNKANFPLFNNQFNNLNNKDENLFKLYIGNNQLLYKMLLLKNFYQNYNYYQQLAINNNMMMNNNYQQNYNQNMNNQTFSNVNWNCPKQFKNSNKVKKSIDKKYLINLMDIKTNKEKRTTIRMMNIPSYFRPSDLAKKLDEKFGISPEKENRVYDFIYIPFKESKKNEGLINAGYAFINFVHPKHILKFYSFFHGKHLKLKTSGKVCIITFASRQGANIKYKGFEQSVNDKYMYFSDTKNHFQLLTD